MRQPGLGGLGAGYLTGKQSADYSSKPLLGAAHTRICRPGTKTATTKETSAMHVFESPHELEAVIGKRIGPGEWLTITQVMIDDFANATGDRQWIHVDVERAKRESPGGKTIAHGYLVLSIIGKMQPTIYTVNSARTLNYGIEKLRFLNAVPVGARIRLSETIKSVEAASGGLRVTSSLIIELEGAERPALAADIIFLYFY